jgi:hypothetical protein
VRRFCGCPCLTYSLLRRFGGDRSLRAEAVPQLVIAFTLRWKVIRRDQYFVPSVSAHVGDCLGWTRVVKRRARLPLRCAGLRLLPPVQQLIRLH